MGSRSLSTRASTAVSILAGLLTVGTALAACGSSNNPAPAASSTAGSSVGPRASINLATNVVSANFAPVLAAQALGYFDKENLDVTVTYSGSSPLPSLLAGRADLVAFGGFSATMATVNTGAPPISTVYNLDSGGVSLYMIGAPNVKTVRDCTRIGNPGAGSAGFTWANTLQAALKTNWTNVPAANAAALQALFASGNIDCMIYVYGGTSSFVQSGKAHWLINPEDTKTYPYPAGISQQLVDEIPAGTIYGLTSWVSANKDVVTRFLRALTMTLPTLRGPAATLTKTIMQVPEYAQSVNNDESKALSDVTHAQFYLSPNAGVISKSSWPAVLDYVIAGGLSYVSKDDPKWAYEKFVDMGPLQTAMKGLPTK